MVLFVSWKLIAGDRPVFFISNRLGFAKYADRIVVMDNGEIAENVPRSTAAYSQK